MAGKVLVPTLAASAGLGYVSGKVVESAVDNGSNDNSGLEQAQQIYNTQLEHYKTASEERRKELERLQEERDKKEKEIKKVEKEIESLQSKLNDPNLTEEDRKKILKKIVILQTDNE